MKNWIPQIGFLLSICTLLPNVLAADFKIGTKSDLERVLKKSQETFIMNIGMEPL